MWKYPEYKDEELCHWGIKGMKWGQRRYQNKNGTLTPEGKRRYAEKSTAEQNTERKEPPKPRKKQAEELSDEELRSRINRLQMEKQYRDLEGQSNIREDDPNRELKMKKERLQLEKDVKNLQKEVHSGQAFVKQVMTDAGRSALTKMATGAMLYAGKKATLSLFDGNTELANAIATGAMSGGNGEKKEKKKEE